VHWAPAVTVWTPGWIAALEAGAHDGAAAAGLAAIAPATTASAATLIKRDCMFPSAS
jgi:hypothetical protein